MTELNVATDFSPFLGGRTYDDGPYSGQQFRDELLRPKLEDALATNTVLHVVFDGVAGMPTSFLEEAFGGLFRTTPGLDYDKVSSVLRLEAGDSELWPFIKLAEQYMKRQASRDN